MRRRTRILWAVAGVLAVLAVGAALVYVWLRTSQPSQTPDDASEERPGIERETIAEFDSFRMVIPVGWERVPARERPNSRIDLFISGPVVDGQSLVIAVQQVEVPKGTLLDGFVDSFTSDWPMHEFPIEQDVSFCGQEARMLGFTNEDGDNLVMMFMHKDKGIVVVSVAPKTRMPDCWRTFYDVLQGFQLYE
ncbi:MAG: hypothetical protein ACLFWB_05525 [Armatimonadota bacterium]